MLGAFLLHLTHSPSLGRGVLRVRHFTRGALAILLGVATIVRAPFGWYVAVAFFVYLLAELVIDFCKPLPVEVAAKANIGGFFFIVLLGLCIWVLFTPTGRAVYFL